MRRRRRQIVEKKSVEGEKKRQNRTELTKDTYETQKDKKEEEGNGNVIFATAVNRL
jgi:hypothetical protein